ncbi:MAG: YihY/virulence factor BrkB family protein [Firmicutes bacterium]|nr:YihY/virulence factor BrkB family protein [Bacillota bacterium]
MRQRALQMIFLGIKQFRDPYYQGFAAQISFYLLLSIVPIFLLLTQILGYFQLSVGDLVQWIGVYTGKQVSGMLESLTAFSSAGAGNVVFVIVALWAASRAQFAIMRITNYTFTEGKNTGKGYWWERLRAMRTMAVTLFTIAFSLVILGYGELLLQTLVGILNLDVDKYINNIWMYLRWFLGLALYFLMVSYNYYILPTNKVPFRKILPGSVFASVGMLLVTLVYARYTTNVANYDIIYGALSSIVAVLFWFYFLAWVLCLGILVNKVWADTDSTKSFSKRVPVERKQ